MNEFLCKMLSISIGTLKDWGNGFEMVIARVYNLAKFNDGHVRFLVRE